MSDNFKMSKNDIIKHLKKLGNELSENVSSKVEDDDIVFAIVDIEDTIHDLFLLINQIKNMNS